jgi:large subunit ribosomal protein L29
MKTRDIRNLKPEDLEKRLAETRLELSKELGGVRMGRAVKNPGRIKNLRKDIAKMMTIRKESQFSAQDKGAKAKPTTSKPADKKSAGGKTVNKPVNRKDRSSKDVK